MGWRDTERRLTLRMARGLRLLLPAQRSFEVLVAGEKTKKPLYSTAMFMNQK